MEEERSSISSNPSLRAPTVQRYHPTYYHKKSFVLLLTNCSAPRGGGPCTVGSYALRKLAGQSTVLSKFFKALVSEHPTLLTNKKNNKNTKK